MKQIWKKFLLVGVILTLLLLTFFYQKEETVQAIGTSGDLGPITSKDVVYQIITDRFYDGDTSNNVPSGFDSALYDGTGTDLKLYQGGDWQGIIDKIPYLKGMGVTAVWISAPYENRDDAIIDYQSGGGQDVWTSFHGYHVRNYFATNKHFGTLSEFEELRDELNDEGIKLIIDFVTNHTSRWQNPTDSYSAEDGKLYEPDKLPNGDYAFDANGEPYDYDSDGNVENLLADPNNDTNGWFHGLGDRGTDTSRFGYRHKELGSLADFSQENSDVIEYLEKAVEFWADLGVNGIRHDATLHMNPAFVKGLKDSVDSSDTITHFGEFFIGRPDSKYDEYVSFPDRTGVNNLDFEYYRSINSTFGDFSDTMSDFADMLDYTQDDYSYENQTVTFLDNHDVSRFGYTQHSSKVYNAALAVLLTSRGIPNIYYGTEQYVTPSEGSDIAGRIFMDTDYAFDTTSDAYELIADLSDLRQDNDAIAYGTTSILYSDDNVMVFERQFYGNHVVVAVNRQPDISYTTSTITTNMPAGTYQDYLGGDLYGGSMTVYNNSGTLTIDPIHLQGGEVSIWSYIDTANTDPHIGDVVSTMGRAGNTVYIFGEGFGTTSTVKFDTTSATVVSCTDDVIEVTVPSGVSAGINDITVTKAATTSNSIEYNVLSGDQNQLIFHVNASTNYGENIYIVGSIPELGSWDTDYATEAMLNPDYPEWFLPVSVPANTYIEFKFIKKDSNGNVTWESGSNRTITSSSDVNGSMDTSLYYWRN